MAPKKETRLFLIRSLRQNLALRILQHQRGVSWVLRELMYPVVTVSCLSLSQSTLTRTGKQFPQILQFFLAVFPHDGYSIVLQIIVVVCSFVKVRTLNEPLGVSNTLPL